MPDLTSLLERVRAASGPNRDAFKDRLRNRRELRGMSQSELAMMTGLQPSSISHFEAGRRKPSFDNVCLLAYALAVSADFLLGADDKPSAFRGEEQLTAHERRFVQDVIDTMLARKRNDA